MRLDPERRLDDNKEVLNYRLSRVCLCVENASGILVSGWRSFLGTVEGDVKLVTDMIKAAVCLHNFLMADNACCPDDYGDRTQGQAVQVVQWMQNVSQIGPCNAVTGKRLAQAAIDMRDTISDYFMSEIESTAAGSCKAELICDLCHHFSSQTECDTIFRFPALNCSIWAYCTTCASLVNYLRATCM